MVGSRIPCPALDRPDGTHANRPLLGRRPVFLGAPAERVEGRSQGVLLADSNGQDQKMELVVHDVNDNNQFDILDDRILVGALDNDGDYAGTAVSGITRAARSNV